MGNGKTTLRNMTNEKIYVTLKYTPGTSTWNKKEIKPYDGCTDVYTGMVSKIQATIEGDHQTLTTQLKVNTEYAVFRKLNGYAIKECSQISIENLTPDTLYVTAMIDTEEPIWESRELGMLKAFVLAFPANTHELRLIIEGANGRTLVI